MNLIDTHCHLTFEPLAGEVEPVIERSRAAGVTGWITVGTEIEDDRKAAALAERFDNMYAAVGIHPHEAKNVTGEILAELRELAQRLKVVAIGETGLDFYRNLSPEDDQRRVFVAQLNIAKELNLPVIVHSRDAFEETVDILERFGSGLKGVVFHCFGGSAEQAKAVLGMGYHISFTGVVTFKNAVKTRQAAQVVPLDRLMLETDCPYMSPEPVRSQKTNEPAFLVHTAKFLAELMGMDLANFVESVTSTTRNFFGLPEGS
jgi:TatD DNase family protein